MLRRNGKPTSCEPCRVSKVRCDHTTPICSRCESKGIASQCFYHPAPLTKAKTQRNGVLPVSACRRKSRRQIQIPSHKDDNSTLAHALHVQEINKSPAGSDRKSSAHLNLPETTSYLAVFRETPWWGSRISSIGRTLEDEFEHWRKNYAYACARLVRLICAVEFYRTHISWFYAKGRFATIPAPLVLEPLRLLEEYVEKKAWNQECNWQNIYDEISAATSQPLEVPSDASPEQFYSLFTGENLRWEFVGFMFAMAGGSVNRRGKSAHTFDLGNGETMDADTFVKEMVLAGNACIEICKQFGHVNDLTIWMGYNNFLVGTEVLGEKNSGERLYSDFGHVVSNVYVMGIHRSHGSSNVPFFISQTRKRVLAAIHKSDKIGATHYGRPPRLPYQYCDFSLPLDLADDQIFLDEKNLEIALSELDDEGWNSKGQFYPITALRMRHIVTTLGEKMLKLTLGSRTTSYNNDLLKTYQSCQEIWDKIPIRFRYHCKSWDETEHPESMIACKAIISLEYLSNVFQIQRLRRQQRLEATKDLLDTSIELLSIIMDMIRRFRQQESITQIPWIFLIHGVPVAGVLVTELHRHTVSNTPLPCSYPRSEIIHNLSYLVSWFQITDLPPSTTHTNCLEYIRLIGRLLDEALDYQPGAKQLQDADQTGVVTLAQASPIPIQLAEGADRSDTQIQLQGLIEAGGTAAGGGGGGGGGGGLGSLDTLWFGGLGMDFCAVGDEAFLGRGREFVSDGLNWFDELEFETSMDSIHGRV